MLIELLTNAEVTVVYQFQFPIGDNATQSERERERELNPSPSNILTLAYLIYLGELIDIHFIRAHTHVLAYA